MKKAIFCAIIALAAVIGFTFTACPTETAGNNPTSATYTASDGDGNTYKLVIAKQKAQSPGTTSGGKPGSGLNGKWVNQAGEEWVMNNGSLTMIVDNVESVRGTYTTSGNYLTITISQVKGSLFGSDAEDIGLSTSQWYTKSQFRTAVIQALVNAGATQSYATTAVDQILAQYPFFDPISGTYSVSGNTLTIDGDTILTRQSGRSAGAVSFSRVVDSSPADRAAYKPKSGDKYTLTINATQTSTGTVISYAGYTITLEHKDGDTFNVTVSGNGITAFSVDIPLDSGITYPKPGTLIPPKNGGGSASNGGVMPNTSGRLTITNLSKHNGKWVLAMAMKQNQKTGNIDTMLIACDGGNTNGDAILTEISGGKATLKVWKVVEVSETESDVVSYKGNDKTMDIFIAVLNQGTIGYNDFYDDFGSMDMSKAMEIIMPMLMGDMDSGLYRDMCMSIMGGSSVSFSGGKASYKFESSLGMLPELD